MTGCSLASRAICHTQLRMLADLSTMVAGYWLYEAVVIGEGFAAALAGVSGNVFQGLAGIAGSYFLVEVLRHTAIPGAYGIGGFVKGESK